MFSYVFGCRTYLCRKKRQNLGYDGVKPFGNLRLERKKKREKMEKDSIKAGMKPQ